MWLKAFFVAISLAALVKAQVVGTDGITTITAPTPSCTATSSATYAWNDGFQQYLFMCGAGSGGSAATMVQVQNFQGCMSACDNYTTNGSPCNGATFYAPTAVGQQAVLSGVTLMTTGSCSLKISGYQTFNAAVGLATSRIAMEVRSLASKSWLEMSEQ